MRLNFDKIINIESISKDKKEIVELYKLYDSESIINILLCVDMKFETLESLVHKINEFKQIYIKDHVDPVFKSRYFYRIEYIIDAICFLIGTKLSIDNYSINNYSIINKITCIVIFEKDLYINLQNSKIKKKV